MSVNLKSVQSCLDSIGFFLSIADVASLPDKKLIAVGWHHTDREGLDNWVSFNVSLPNSDCIFNYRLNSPLKCTEIRHVIRCLNNTIRGDSSEVHSFKVIYEGIPGWQDVKFEIDPNWKVIKLLPISTKNQISSTIPLHQAFVTLNSQVLSVEVKLQTGEPENPNRGDGFYEYLSILLVDEYGKQFIWETFVVYPVKVTDCDYFDLQYTYEPYDNCIQPGDRLMLVGNLNRDTEIPILIGDVLAVLLPKKN
jgi:hypothetical protein